VTVSVKDVAARAGVSIGTVSNVLNNPDKVSASTARRVRNAIEVLGYVRNDAARQLRAGRSRAIGLVVLDVSNPFFAEMARGAEDQAARAGFSVIVGNSAEQEDRELAHLDLFDEQRVHGVLVTPAGQIDERLRRLRERGIPAVLVDRLSTDTSFSSVSVDDVMGGRIAVTHLIEQGARRVAYISGPPQLRQVRERLEGATSAVSAHPDVALQVVPAEALTLAAGHVTGEHIARMDRAARPDAIFAANDLVAIGVLQALAAARIRVPHDMMLIGYDDIDFARSTVVPLSSVRQPAAEIGASGVRILLDQAANPNVSARHVVYQPTLVPRESTGA
jgi:LacI family transcriptional regulator